MPPRIHRVSAELAGGSPALGNRGAVPRESEHLLARRPQPQHLGIRDGHRLGLHRLLILLLGFRLVLGYLEEEEISGEVKKILNDALKRAEDSPLPDTSSLTEGVYATPEDLDTPHHK